MSAPPTQRSAYARAGVDIDAGERVVELLRGRLAGGGITDLLGGLGGFASAVALPVGLREPVIVTATDGVGTKTEIARLTGRLDGIGWDLVAMCADDVVCHGARPWLFLDYVAVGRVEPERVATIVGGIAAACEACGCALVGGETAEHPGIMPADGFDLAGVCIGLVERDGLLDGSSARPGDVVIGLSASGLHANGFSLVRAMVEQHGLSMDDGYVDLVQWHLGDGAVDRAMAEGHRTATLGDVLLTPTRLYAPDVLALRDALGAAGMRLSGLAHITGGGLVGNLPRAVADGLAIRVRPRAWVPPTPVELIGSLAGLDGPGSRATLNAGIGMAAVVEPGAAAFAADFLADRGIASWVIGDVVRATDAATRYIEA